MSPIDYAALRGERPADGTQPPLGLTNLHALLSLYALADWRSIVPPPGPGWFRAYGLLTGITNDNRGVSLRLARQLTCIAFECDETLSENSTGDHIISLTSGGPASAENYMPLCGRCNSSKQGRDLLEWWWSKDWPFRFVPRDVLISYARLSYRHLHRMRQINGPASVALIAAVDELRSDLPTSCAVALDERVQWMVGIRA